MTLASYMDKNIEVEFNNGKKIDGILVRYKSKYALAKNLKLTKINIKDLSEIKNIRELETEKCKN